MPAAIYLDYNMLPLCYQRKGIAQRSIAQGSIAPSNTAPKSKFSFLQQVKSLRLPEVLELPIAPSAFQQGETLRSQEVS